MLRAQYSSKDMSCPGVHGVGSVEDFSGAIIGTWVCLVASRALTEFDSPLDLFLSERCVEVRVS